MVIEMLKLGRFGGLRVSVILAIEGRSRRIASLRPGWDTQKDPVLDKKKLVINEEMIFFL